MVMTMRKKCTLYLVIAMLILSLAACVSQVNQPPAGVPPPIPSPSAVQNGLENTHWSLASFGPVGAEKPVVESSNVTLLAADGKFGGFGGCNSYGGAYEITGDQLSFHDINSTLKACADEQIMQQEQRYFEALQSAGTFAVKDNRLTIGYDSGKGVLVFKKAVITTG
jgi:heat shock protein HslJ